MNLLLLLADELDANGAVALADRRARHLLQVLRVVPGQGVRCGLLDGPLGDAVVTAVDGDRVQLQCAFAAAAPPATADVLLLAVPRPKVLQRVLEHAAALGFARIVLFRSWRVDKSHLDSRLLQPAAWREHLLLGLEQARRTQLPRVQVFPLFKPFVEDHLEALALPPSRFCAHPPAGTGTCDLRLPPGAPFALALGPEGGFLPYEVDQLARRGFLPVHAGSHALRTETALGVLAGQLDLLRRQTG